MRWGFRKQRKAVYPIEALAGVKPVHVVPSGSVTEVPRALGHLTDDRNDPRLTHGADEVPVPQAEVYLVLSEEERAKGFVRPLRRSYRHVGPAGPRYELRDLTSEECALYGGTSGLRPDAYVKYEAFPESEAPAVGRFWTQRQLDAVDSGCGTVTTMGLALSETSARNPQQFYGATYCCGCSMHRPVAEFVWVEDGERVGS